MERTTLEALKLSGSHNVKRFTDRAKREANAPARIDRSEEIAQLDALIAKTLKACAKGSTRNRKQNPSFNHLAILMRLRAELLAGPNPAAKESDADVIAAADKLMGLNQ
jgi:hypothetical protein